MQILITYIHHLAGWSSLIDINTEFEAPADCEALRYCLFSLSECIQRQVKEFIITGAGDRARDTQRRSPLFQNGARRAIVAHSSMAVMRGIF